MPHCQRRELGRYGLHPPSSLAELRLIIQSMGPTQKSSYDECALQHIDGKNVWKNRHDFKVSTAIFIPDN